MTEKNNGDEWESFIRNNKLEAPEPAEGHTTRARAAWVQARSSGRGFPKLFSGLAVAAFALALIWIGRQKTIQQREHRVLEFLEEAALDFNKEEDSTLQDWEQFAAAVSEW